MKQNRIEISLVTQVDANLVASFAQLFPQLTRNSPPPDEEMLEKIIQSENSHIFIARDLDSYGRIVGTLTLAFYISPTGIKAWIEDVVVDASFRGKGIGKALTQRAIELARAEDAKVVLLTSNPARLAANELYQKLGFSLRNTNFYQLKL